MALNGGISQTVHKGVILNIIGKVCKVTILRHSLLKLTYTEPPTHYSTSCEQLNYQLTILKQVLGLPRDNFSNEILEPISRCKGKGLLMCWHNFMLSLLP